MTPATSLPVVLIVLNGAVLPVLINLATNDLPEPPKKYRWLVWVALIISLGCLIALVVMPESLRWLPTLTQVILTVVLLGTVLPLLTNLVSRILRSAIGRRRPEIWLGIAVVSLACVVLTPTARASRPLLPVCKLSSALATGCITSPIAGASVSRKIEVTGRVAGIPAGKSLWLAVLINDMVWPKERVYPFADGGWTRTIIEGGSPPAGTFHLVLLMADSEDDEMISRWVDQGIKMNSWPGLESTPGSDPLAMVQGLTLS